MTLITLSGLLFDALDKVRGEIALALPSLNKTCLMLDLALSSIGELALSKLLPLSLGDTR